MVTDTELRKLGVSDLHRIILDSDEIRKGAEILDRKDLLHFSRQGNKLYGQAKGSEPQPYKVKLTFSDTSTDIKASCTCPAARNARKPFCKHAAALLVAWQRAPEQFVMGSADAEGERRKTTVKKGAVQRGDLMKEGIAQV